MDAWGGAWRPARGSNALAAEQVKVDVALAKPNLLAGQKQVNYVRVGLTGLRINESGQRTPVNLAIVLDKSGSMSGDKLRKAKDAAIASIDRLGSDDIVSVVAYDHYGGGAGARHEGLGSGRHSGRDRTIDGRREYGAVRGSQQGRGGSPEVSRSPAGESHHPAFPMDRSNAGPSSPRRPGKSGSLP